MDHHYHINVFWSENDSCWIADFPDLRGCSALGNSPEQAIAEARVALELWLETMADDGLPIPEALYRPSNLAA